MVMIMECYSELDVDDPIAIQCCKCWCSVWHILTSSSIVVVTGEDSVPEGAVASQPQAELSAAPATERSRQQLWKAAIKLPMYSVALIPLTVRCPHFERARMAAATPIPRHIEDRDGAHAQ